MRSVWGRVLAPKPSLWSCSKRLFILKSPKALSRGPSRACRTRPIYYKFPLNVQWNETLQVCNNPLQVNGQPFTGRENRRQKIAIGRGSSLFCGGRGSETVSPGRVAGPVCYDCRHKEPVAPLAPLAGRAGAALSWEGRKWPSRALVFSPRASHVFVVVQS